MPHCDLPYGRFSGLERATKVESAAQYQQRAIAVKGGDSLQHQGLVDLRPLEASSGLSIDS
jgi:hypothetical protein